MKSHLSRALALVFVVLVLPLRAADVPGSKDPALLKRIPGSEIIWHRSLDFDWLRIALERIEWDYSADKFKPSRKETVKGAHTILYYKLPEGMSTLEAIQQYEAALKPAGFETLFTGENDRLDDGYSRFVRGIFPMVKKIDTLQYLHEFNHHDQRYLAMRSADKGENSVYVSFYAFGLEDVSTGFEKMVRNHQLAKGQSVLRVDVLESKAGVRMPGPVTMAADLIKDIRTNGRAAVYGVRFDSSKAEIGPESAACLKEIAKAVNHGQGQKFLIVAHTANAGNYLRSQELSQARATAIATELSKNYGVPASCLVPMGVGMACPLTSNQSALGRYKNRRVEIVAM